MALDNIYLSPDYNAYTNIGGMELAMIEVGVIHKNDFWDLLDVPTKEILIEVATKQMNKIAWKGGRNTDIVVPSMLWPRTGIPDIDDTTIPKEIILKMACWITYNALQSTHNKSKNIASKKVGDVSVTYKNTNSVEDTEPCANYASDYLDTNSLTFGGIGAVSIQRGL